MLANSTVYKIIVLHNDKHTIEYYPIIPRIGDYVHVSFYDNMVMVVASVLIKPLNNNNICEADAAITLRHRL